MMIADEIKNIKSGKVELRKFGLTVGIVLGLLGALLFWRGRGYYPYLLVPSAILLLLCVAAPTLLKPVHKAWMTLAVLMGWFMTRVILCALFYLMVTPIGLLGRLVGKEFLELKLNRSAPGSYWIPREVAKHGKENYERQF